MRHQAGFLSVRNAIALLALASTLAFLAGCVAPFSDLQSAKLVGKGNFEVTPGYSSISGSDEGESQKLQENYGAQIGYGLTKFMDLRLRYEYVRTTGDPEANTKTNIIGFGPKFRLVKNWLAFYVPVGFAFGGDLETGASSDTWQIHPTLLATVSFGKFLELNPSAKVMIPFSNGDRADTLYAFNLGAAISADVNKWAIRPEVGFCTGVRGGGTFIQFSIGFTLNSALFK